MARGDHIYVRGNMIWMTVKVDGRWVTRSTGYRIGEEEKAKALALYVQTRVTAALVDPNLETRFRVFEKSRRTRAMTKASKRIAKSADGIIYAISLHPAQIPNRLKLGYTAKALQFRLSQIRTTCPEAVVLGAWPGNSAFEQHVLRSVPGRVGKTEVFDVTSVEDTLTTIDLILGHRLAWAR